MWIAAGCAALCLLVCLPLYMHYKVTCFSLGVCFKGLGTLCAFLPALIAALKLDPLCWVCAAALALHSVADVLLELHFGAGMGVFLLGHICYIAFFLSLFPLSAAHAVCAAALLAGLFLLLRRYKKEVGKSLVPFACYGTVLSCMSVCGIAGGAAAGTVQGLLIALGSALFLFSDGLLFRRLLFPAGRGTDWTVMATYYAAQLLLGISCLLF